MNREKKVIISVIAVLLIIAIIGVTLLVINNNANEFKLIGEKFSDNYYDNGWSKEAVAEVKNDTIPIPTGFSCEKEIDDDTIIIKDEQGNKYLWVPYDENIDPTPYEEEVKKYYGDLGIKSSSAETISSMQNYGGFYIGITENKENIINVNISEEEYAQKKEEVEEIYDNDEVVEATLLGYDELVTFLHYRDILDNEFGLQLTDKAYELATTDSTTITTDETTTDETTTDETTTDETTTDETTTDETTTDETDGTTTIVGGDETTSVTVDNTKVSGGITVEYEDESNTTNTVVEPEEHAPDIDQNREKLDDDELITVSDAREELQTYYLDGKQNNIKNLNSIESKVIVKDEWEEYVDEVIITDVIANYSNVVPIPKGFRYYNGKYVSNGMDENNGIAIVDNNNENLVYVWIPVEEDLEQVKEDLKEKYQSYYADSSYDMSEFDNLTEELPDELIQSIAEYGGFYMSEAELGYDDNANLYNRQRGMKKNENGDWYVNIGDYYRKVEDSNKKAGITYTDEMLNLTYDNAVSIASGVYEGNDDYGVISHLTYGAEWDAAMLYLLSCGKTAESSDYTANNLYIIDNSTEIGKYTSGGSNYNGYIKAKKINGLWGLAGNLAEITQEKQNGNIVTRGGSYADLGNVKPMASRSQATDNNVNTGDIGFRTCLYIKPTGMANTGDIDDEINKIDNDDIKDEVTTLIEYTESDTEDDIIDTMNTILELAEDEVGTSDSDYIDLETKFSTISSQSTVKEMVAKIEYYKNNIVKHLQSIFGSTSEDDDIYDEIAKIDNSTVRTYVKNLVGYTTNTTESTINTTITNILKIAGDNYDETDTYAEYIELRNMLNDILDYSVEDMISEIDANKYEIVEYLQDIFGTIEDEVDIEDEIDNIDNNTVRSSMSKLINYTADTNTSKFKESMDEILKEVGTSDSYYSKLDSIFNKIKRESSAEDMVDAIEDYQYEIVRYLQDIFGTIEDDEDDIYDEIAKIKVKEVRTAVKTLVNYTSSSNKTKISNTIEDILDLASDEVGTSDSDYIKLEDLLDEILVQKTVSKMISKITSYEDDIVEYLKDIFGEKNSDDIQDMIDEINNADVRKDVTRLVNYTTSTSSSTISTTITNILAAASDRVETSDTYYKELKSLLKEITSQTTIAKKIDKIEEKAEEIIDSLINIFVSSTDEDIYNMIEKINNDDVEEDVKELIEYTSSTSESTINEKLEDILSVAKNQVGGSNITTPYYTDLEEIFYDIMTESTPSRKISIIKSKRTEIVRYLIRIFSYDELYANIWSINNDVKDDVENLVEYTSNSSRTTINSTITKILSKAKIKVGVSDSNYIELKKLLDEITKLSTSSKKVSKIADYTGKIVDYLINIFGTSTSDEIYDMIDKINDDKVEGEVKELIYTSTANSNTINEKVKNILTAAENKLVPDDSNYNYLKSNYDSLRYIFEDIVGTSELSGKVEIIDSSKVQIVRYLIRIFNDNDLYVNIGKIENDDVRIDVEDLTFYTSNSNTTQINSTIDNILSKSVDKVGTSDSNYMALEKILNEIKKVESSSNKVRMISNSADTIVDYLINIFGSDYPELIVPVE